MPKTKYQRNHIGKSNFLIFIITTIFLVVFVFVLLFVGGEMCIRHAIARQWYQLINTLICYHNCDPQHLSLDSCSTPVHSALVLGLHKDPG